MSYAKYPKEMKEAVVSRIMSGEETISDIGRDTGININTLYRCSPEKRTVSNYQVQEC
ncbi:transposase [Eubacterium ventriosum]|jgi:transposase|uniref:transposase n=1 Tax=Eubacterium ventriosum TaxID=39496 RepID=UPI00351FB8B2